jgi:hypothetical protein
VLPRLRRQGSFYRYIFAINPDEFGATHEVVSAALGAEGIPSDSGYPPMHHYDLFQPQRSRLPVAQAFPERFNFGQMRLPEAERAGERESVWLDERIFRADRSDIDDVVRALEKVRAGLSAAPDVIERIQKQLGVVKVV